ASAQGTAAARRAHEALDGGRSRSDRRLLCRHRFERSSRARDRRYIVRGHRAPGRKPRRGHTGDGSRPSCGGAAGLSSWQRRRLGGIVIVASARWDALGTTAEIFVANETELEHAREILANELEAIDLACSRFREDSEVARVNACPGRWVDVSRLFLEAVHV